MRSTVVAAALLLLGAGGGGTVPVREPILAFERSSTALGEVLVVRLEGWPDGDVVTVSICGNEARRASQDCDPASSTVAEIRPGAASFVRTPVARPPVGCPCVLRAATARHDVVRIVPIDLPGVPDLRPEEWEALTPPGTHARRTATRRSGTSGNVDHDGSTRAAFATGGVVAAAAVLALVAWRRLRRGANGHIVTGARPLGDGEANDG